VYTKIQVVFEAAEPEAGNEVLGAECHHADDSRFCWPAFC
jgi:hypothetical protein